MTTRIMIVDDSNMIRNRISRVCQAEASADCEVVATARNGLEALSMCAASNPDLVTMDLTMPGMDGEACIEALVKRYPNLLILVVSALSDKATAIRALKKGAHGFLYKPFTDDQLIASLRELSPVNA
ncbi:response regulator transcription factor [Zoogloea sp.]|uniref:response regulator transcription factor n=2 Tax=Zoogloea sp. TaxID=49181 RepID=UPI0035B21D26|nr:response regulator [Rhodocyclales bacterium]